MLAHICSIQSKTSVYQFTSSPEHCLQTATENVYLTCETISTKGIIPLLHLDYEFM